MKPQKSLYALAVLALVAGLAACGGGGGGSSPLPVGGGGGGSSPLPVGGGGGSTPTPVSSPISTPGSQTTNASGVVVDDANGNPLAGVPVKLMPWGPCGATPAPSSITPENDGCPTPLPSPQATTNPNGDFVLNGAPNGHYLLVVGTDTVATPLPGYAPPTCTNACPTPSPNPFSVQATVHDNVTLTGGNQTLHAPTLPPVPAGYVPPVWETNGDYRLATLNEATEMPCLVAWQYERALRGLSMGSVDEWSLENTRAVNAYFQTPGSTTATLISLGGYQNSGGTDCANANVILVCCAINN